MFQICISVPHLSEQWEVLEPLMMLPIEESFAVQPLHERTA